MNNTKTGKFISACRKELGLTQCQLAEKLNVTDKAVSKWENGKCAPDIATLIPLAETLEVSVVEILNGKQMEQVELQMEADVAIVDTMKKSKKKIIISVICAVAVVLVLFSLVPAYHYFSTVSGDRASLLEDVYASNSEENRVLKMVEKGDYIVLLLESPGNISCAIYRRDEMFRDRYWISMGPTNRPKGELMMSAFGEDGLAVNVFYGAELPSQYTKYTFGYRNYQYICPIEEGIVLDVFIEASGDFTHAYDIELLE